jgi:hypothetical protein
VFVALVVLMNAIGYWYSDRIALTASRAIATHPPSAERIRRLRGYNLSILSPAQAA